MFRSGLLRLSFWKAITERFKREANSMAVLDSDITPEKDEVSCAVILSKAP